MNDDPRIQQLLDQLHDSQRTPEEICELCPDLLPEVSRRWRQMCRVRDQLEALFPSPSESDATKPKPPIRLDEPALPRIPGYEVESLLGRGGMGVVFRARHLRLNRLVALKTVLAGAYAGSHERNRFQREAEAAAGLQHPNVVQIYEVGDSDGRPYFTMEYVEGGSLSQKLAGTPQPAREAAALVATLASAVHIAHEAGIVHRDLKPGNVLLAVDGTPKISDFGLARRLDAETGLTWTGLAIGTPSYMAPEQARGQKPAVGPLADVYSLGAILYEMLTGRPPFRAETSTETIQQVISQDPVPPSRWNGKVPRDLETICLKCLHKEPRHRYATAAALAADLNHFLNGEAISARPESSLARLSRRIRRRLALSAMVAVAAVLSVALIGVGLWAISDRAAKKGAAIAEQTEMERDINQDLTEMSKCLRKSSWIAARAELDRAKGRLGNRKSADFQCLLEQGERDLELAARLDVIRMNCLAGEGDVFKDYEKAFQNAGLGKVSDDPDLVASRIRDSNIRQALVDALDHWAVRATVHANAPLESWLLEVTRKADPDPHGWRDDFRTSSTRKNQKALTRLAESVNIESTPANLLAALGEILHFCGGDANLFLAKVQLQYPKDFWVNFLAGHCAKNEVDTIRYYQAAQSIRPNTAAIEYNLGYAMMWNGRSSESVPYFERAVQIDPENATYRAGYSRSLMSVDRDGDAFEQIQIALASHPNSTNYKLLQIQLRMLAIKRKQWDEARVAWAKELQTNPPAHDSWYGYAELCLFLGLEDEYRSARRALLNKFSQLTHPQVVERTARACLLGPITGEELRQAASLAERAVDADRKKYGAYYQHFMFVLGLAEYRQGRFDRAISILRGDASGVLGPAPRLVLAMALHQKGDVAAARTTLAEAALAHDWRPSHVRDQDDWISHVLRREAEGMIFPKLKTYFQCAYPLQSLEERLALLPECQFRERHGAAAQFYFDALKIAPKLADNLDWQVRFYAACSASRAGCGRCIEGDKIGAPERLRWRESARNWLRANLEDLNKELKRNPDLNRGSVRSVLRRWLNDPDLAELRDPAGLDKLAEAERKDCLALWDQVRRLIKECQAYQK